jgi:hypothetical protein
MSEIFSEIKDANFIVSTTFAYCCTPPGRYGGGRYPNPGASPPAMHILALRANNFFSYC